MKEYDGPLAPALPPKDGRQDFPITVRKMLNQLVDRVRSYAKDNNRLRGLVLFKERKLQSVGSNGREARPISEVMSMDRPEVELILHHRDVVLEIEDKSARIAEKLKDMTPDSPEAFADLARITGHINGMEEKRLKHIASMENILKNLSMERVSREQIMAKLAADGAKMAQAAQQHEDKMEIARKDSDTPTTEDLFVKLAAKYNITVDQARAMLSAKAVEPEPNDA